MKQWQKHELHRCVDLYNATGDIQHLMDVPNILAYRRHEAVIKERVEECYWILKSGLKRFMESLN
ncbi:hypothetical protein KBI51_09560 [Aerococcaceae bacterium zg-ZUI334]|uniref:hypothetical protein n=1 Tax=Aerococcaceae bacterium zg-252 TaxID=2796928 RepID=UPI001B96AA9D|nr:hypothetical protein [Aerococcaceae bacterium zg-ZUI334]